MTHFLAQAGGGGGSWINPATVRVLLVAGFLLISVLGSVIKKANEQRQKRRAELARDRREEDALRTGRPAVNLSDTGEFEAIKDKAPSQSAKQATAEDARKKLQELAERRRRELAEMMRRAQQGSTPVTPPVASSSVPRMPAPPSMAPPSTQLPRPRQQQMPKPRPQQAPQQQRRSPMPQPQAKSGQDVDARRRRDAQAQRDGANQSAAKGRATDAETSRRETIEKIAKGVAAGPTVSAYDLPGTRRAESTAAAVSGVSVGAALARVGAGAKTASAAEWRKAIVLSELLHRPVGMREDGERVI